MAAHVFVGELLRALDVRMDGARPHEPHVLETLCFKRVLAHGARRRPERALRPVRET